MLAELIAECEYLEQGSDNRSRRATHYCLIYYLIHYLIHYARC